MPPKVEQSKKLSHVVTVRLTGEQHAWLESAKSEYGASASKVIVDALVFAGVIKDAGEQRYATQTKKPK